MLPRRFANVWCFALVALVPGTLQAQIRVATYNTLDGPVNASEDALFSTIFTAIGIKDVNGMAKRVDVISVQEQTTFASFTTASRMADALNTLYGVTSYTSDLSGFGTDKVGIVYDSSTLDLLADTIINTTGPRFTYRAQFRPVGYTSSDAEFYLYSSHFKAGSSGSDITTRTGEGEALSKEIMPDYLHLSVAGYRIWAEAIEAKVAELLGEK